MDKYPIPATAYGASKAALNYVVRKIHVENEGLIAFPLHPGWVRTDMGNHGAEVMGIEQAPVSLEESVQGMLNKVCNSGFVDCVWGVDADLGDRLTMRLEKRLRALSSLSATTRRFHGRSWFRVGWLKRSVLDNDMACFIKNATVLCTATIHQLSDHQSPSTK